MKLFLDFFLRYIQKDSRYPNGQPIYERRTKGEGELFVFSRKDWEEISRFRDSESKIEFVDEIRKKISDLIVINVEISREEDAYEIFETTNARGLELSVADLLKNLVFRKIKADGYRDFAKDTWQEITADIEATETDLRKFIRYFWISKYSFISEKKLYREIKKKITDWQELLLDLIENSYWYNKLYEGNEQDFLEIKNGKKIFKAIMALRLMQVTQCHVLLMAILRNMDLLGTDPTKVIQFIERFSFQYSAVCKLPTNRVEKTYSKYAIKIETTLKDPEKKEKSAAIQTIFHELKAELRDSHLRNCYS